MIFIHIILQYNLTHSCETMFTSFNIPAVSLCYEKKIKKKNYPPPPKSSPKSISTIINYPFQLPNYPPSPSPPLILFKSGLPAPFFFSFISSPLLPAAEGGGVVELPSSTPAFVAVSGEGSSADVVEYVRVWGKVLEAGGGEDEDVGRNGVPSISLMI